MWGIYALLLCFSIRAESSDVVDDIIDSLITQKVRGYTAHKVLSYHCVFHNTHRRWES